MKKILSTIILLIVSFSSFSQTFTPPRSSSIITVQDSRYRALLNFYQTHTHGITMNGGLDSLGMTFYEDSSGHVWYRDTVLSGGHKWSYFLKNGDAGNGTVTQVNTGYGLNGGPINATGTITADTGALSMYWLRRRDSITSYVTPTQMNTQGFLKTIAGIAAGGDLTGTYQNPSIASNAVNFSKFQQLPGFTFVANPTASLANTQPSYFGYGLKWNNDSIKVDTSLLKLIFGGGGGGSGITQLTGDGTAGPGAGSVPFTLATVNSNTGIFGDASHVSQITLNGKGLATAAASASILIGESQVTNLTTDLAAKEPTITASNTVKQYFNGYKQFVALNTDSIAQGSTNKFFTASDTVGLSSKLINAQNGLTDSANTALWGGYIYKGVLVKSNYGNEKFIDFDSTSFFLARSIGLNDSSKYLITTDTSSRYVNISAANARASGYLRTNLVTTNDAVVSLQAAKIGSTLYGAPLIQEQSSDSSILLKANLIEFQPSDILTSHPGYVWTISDTVKGSGHWAASAGGTQNLTYTQNATNNNLAISGGNNQNFLPATSTLAGLLDTARAKYVDSAKARLINFNLFTHNGIYASGGDSIGLGTNPLDQNTTINTTGFTFSITGLPSKATALGTDSVVIENLAGQLFKLPVPSGGGGLTPIANHTYLGVSNITGSTATPSAVSQPYYVVTDYPGIVGDSTTDCTTGLQNLINFVPAGATLFFPPGRYIVTATLFTLPGKPIQFRGSGYMNRNTGPGFSSTNGFGPSAIVFNVTNDTCLANRANGSSFFDLAIVCANTTTTTTNIGLALDSANNVTLDKVFIFGFNENLDISAGVFFHINRCVFTDGHTYDVRVRGYAGLDAGDSRIGECLFSVTNATVAGSDTLLSYDNAGGLQVTHNKFANGGLPINCNWLGFSDVHIDNNSLEGYSSPYAIKIKMAQSGSSLFNTHIVNNQITHGGSGGELISMDATTAGTAMYNVLIDANIFQGNASDTAIVVKGTVSSTFKIGATNVFYATTPIYATSTNVTMLAFPGSVNITESPRMKLDMSLGNTFIIPTLTFSDTIDIVNGSQGNPFVISVTQGASNFHLVTGTGVSNQAQGNATIALNPTSGKQTVLTGYSNGITGGGNIVGTKRSYVNGSIPITVGNDLSENNANLFWDNTNLRLGVKNNSPQAPLHVTDNQTGFNNPFSGMWSEMNSTDAGPARLTLLKSRGTYAAKTTVLNGDFIGSMAFEPYDGTSNKQVAGIGAKVVGTVATNSIPTDMFIFTGPSNLSASSWDPYADGIARMTFKSAGNIIIGNQAVDSNAFLQFPANTTTNAQIWLKGSAADVTSPTPGMMWYNSTTHTLNFRDNGTNINLLAAGSGGITGLTTGFIPVATSATTIGNSTISQITNGYKILSGASNVYASYFGNSGLNYFRAATNVFNDSSGYSAFGGTSQVNSAMVNITGAINATGFIYQATSSSNGVRFGFSTPDGYFDNITSGGGWNFRTNATSTTALALSSAGKATFLTPTASVASINLPHGVAPTSPVNGDIWTTTAGAFARINSATINLGGINTVGAFSGSSQTNGASISGTTITYGPSDGTNPGMVSTSAQTFAGVKTHTNTIISSGGFYNSVPGAQIAGQASTINNAVTAASGTVSNFSNYAFLAPTITSTNTSISYNNPATLRIDNSPTMSTNSTATGISYALDVAAGISHFGVGSSSISGIFDGSVSLGTTANSSFLVNIGPPQALKASVLFTSAADPTNAGILSTSGAMWYNGTNLKMVDGSGIPRDVLNGIHNYLHSIFTPTTGGTVNLVDNQYNIINPTGALVALTVNLPSSPNNNDVVYIKYTQTISTVTYANGTVVDGITAPTAGGLVVLTFDGGTTSWY